MQELARSRPVSSRTPKWLRSRSPTFTPHECVLFGRGHGVILHERSRARLRAVRPPPRSTVRRFQRRLLAWYAEHGRDLPWRRTRHRTACWCPRSCSSRPRSIGSCRSTASSSVTIRPSSSSPRRRWTPCGGSGTRSATTSARFGSTRSRARPSPATAADCPIEKTRCGSCRASGATPRARSSRSPTAGTRPSSTPTCGASLGRVFLGPRRLARVRGQRAFWDLAAALVPPGRGYDFNQALMDFGATWCTPRKPRCVPCPMKRFCASYGLPSSSRSWPRLVRDEAGRYLSPGAAPARTSPASGSFPGASASRASRSRRRSAAS